MRIPHNINKNTFKTYQPSEACLRLLDEQERTLRLEDFEWDNEHCPTLKKFCVDVIKKNFETKPLLDELPCPDRNYLLEILDTNLPLELVVPLIEDEYYWKRRYEEKFGEFSLKRTSTLWKPLYIEQHIQDILEKAEPEYNDEDEIGDITKLCCSYVKKLEITQLQHWKPPRYWSEEDIPEKFPTDHINFDPIFKNLTQIEEFSVIFGMNNVGQDFEWHMFEISLNDCHRLGKSVNLLKSLKVLRIHRSRIDDERVRALTQGLIKNETLKELDLSHCDIEDDGALCIAKLIMVHPTLKILNLCNNRIRGIGGEGLGFAILQRPTGPLRSLNIKLNPLGEQGVMGLLRPLVRDQQIEELSIAACLIDGDGPIRIGQMLKLNNTLKKLDVSNNWFDKNGGEQLVSGMEINRTLEWLDVRETDITREQQAKINKYLIRNRSGLTSVTETDTTVSEETTQISENQGEPTGPDVTITPSEE